MRRALAALLTGALVLSGCGGGSSPGSGAPQGESNPTREDTSKGTPEDAEASIEKYGEEAEGSDREALLGAFHAYLGALADGDGGAACAHLAAPVRRSLEQMARRERKPLSCARLLVLLTPQAAKMAARQQGGRIVRVRVKEDTAFVVFRAPGARLYELTMAREGGAWKATTLLASVLAPSLPPAGQ